MNTPKKSVIDKLEALESKIDFVLSAVQNKRDSSKYMTAQDIEREYGIDQRTVLNRSNLDPTEKRFIPSLKINGKGRRKYFERKVIERLLKPNR